MCGIVASTTGDVRAVEAALRRIAHRGPDATAVVERGGVVLGHVRLSIVDVDSRSDQPFTYGQTTVAYNGELWNWRALREALEADGLTFTTEGDTEVVAAALDRWGSDALDRFDGMFVVAWTTGDGALHAARDRFGEIPAHLIRTGGGVYVTSELKALPGVSRLPTVWLEPGEHATIRGRDVTRRRYYRASAVPAHHDDPGADLAVLLSSGVARRAVTTDVPTCCLLSGGIDSALIAAMLVKAIGPVPCYTAVLDRASPDLKAARVVAAHLGCPLIEVPVPAPTVDGLADVVNRIELPHKAQVEIGWACLQLAARIRSDGFKVTYTGEGSDELWASYGFSYHGVQQHGWYEYRRRLFADQARKNFPRCNKVFMAHSVEVRLPFLSPDLVEFALSLDVRAVTGGDRPGPKRIMADAAEGWLPTSIGRRSKLAFQDGLGLKPLAGRVLPDPAKFYRAEHARLYGRKAA